MISGVLVVQIADDGGCAGTCLAGNDSGTHILRPEKPVCVCVDNRHVNDQRVGNKQKRPVDWFSGFI